MSQRELTETSIVRGKDWVEIDDMYPDLVLPGNERTNLMIVEAPVRQRTRRQQ